MAGMDEFNDLKKNVFFCMKLKLRFKARQAQFSSTWRRGRSMLNKIFPPRYERRWSTPKCRIVHRTRNIPLDLDRPSVLAQPPRIKPRRCRRRPPKNSS